MQLQTPEHLLPEIEMTSSLPQTKIKTINYRKDVTHIFYLFSSRQSSSLSEFICPLIFNKVILNCSIQIQCIIILESFFSSAYNIICFLFLFYCHRTWADLSLSPSLFLFLSFFFFQTVSLWSPGCCGSYYISQIELECTVILSWFSEGWDYSHKPLYLNLEFSLNVIILLDKCLN